jgi:hypothetical protein
MGEYLLALAGMSVVIALVCVVVPAQGQAHVKLLCSLCVVCLVCVPLVRTVKDISQGEWEIPEEWIGSDAQEPDYGQVADRLLVGQLHVLLEQKFGIAADQCRILVQWDEQDRVTQVTLVLSGKAIWQDPDPICAYVRQLIGCECKVVLD